MCTNLQPPLLPRRQYEARQAGQGSEYPMKNTKLTQSVSSETTGTGTEMKLQSPMTQPRETGRSAIDISRIRQPDSILSSWLTTLNLPYSWRNVMTGTQITTGGAGGKRPGTLELKTVGIRVSLMTEDMESATWTRTGNHTSSVTRENGMRELGVIKSQARRTRTDASSQQLGNQ